jgi:hypothetical protein
MKKTSPLGEIKLRLSPPGNLCLSRPWELRAEFGSPGANVAGRNAFPAGLLYAYRTHPQANQGASGFAAAAACLELFIYGDFNLEALEIGEKLRRGDPPGRISR